jgi:hypothetical protein
MAELCELESMDCQPQEGLDYDDYVAQIEFEDPSMMSLEQSAFVSMLADPGLISTDSLDMANIRARCEDTKNDYKLTFEDSGQWTTSGVFSTNTAATASPPTNAGTKRIVKLNLREEGDSINQNFSLRLLEQLNDGWSEDKRKPSPLADDLNSKKNNVNPRHFDVIEATSWRQQIKNDELYCQDEGTSSNMHSDSKEVSNNKQQSHYSKQKQCGEQIRKMPKETNGINDNGSKSRPSKLLANFLERQRLLNGHMQNNYELDNERMVDLNENEIGYAPVIFLCHVNN